MHTTYIILNKIVSAGRWLVGLGSFSWEGLSLLPMASHPQQGQTRFLHMVVSGAESQDSEGKNKSFKAS